MCTSIIHQLCINNQFKELKENIAEFIFYYVKHFAANYIAV